MGKNFITVFILGSIFYAPWVGSQNVSTHYMMCKGSRVTDDRFHQNETEALVLTIDNDLRDRSSKEPGKTFGTLKFSKSREPMWGGTNLNVCFDDVLNFNLEPVCILDQPKWPSEVSSIYRKCTLNKVSLKFDCFISIRYVGDRKPLEATWDYECFRAECSLCK
jgi:hypothetical protein